MAKLYCCGLCVLMAIMAGGAGPDTAPVATASALATRPSTRPIRVAIYTDEGAGTKGGDDVTACLAKAGDAFVVTRVNAGQIRNGVLTDADVIIQGGGGASKQANTLGPEGRKKICQFVDAGGGYLGICAGAYLASTDYTWSLGLLNAKVLDRKHWNRGSGVVVLALTARGKEKFDLSADSVQCQYFQGPLLAPDDKPGLPAFESLATFDTEIAKNGAPEGIMKGTTAAASAAYGKGRVIAISPHPERSEGLDGVIRRSVAWTAGRTDVLPPATQPASGAKVTMP